MLAAQKEKVKELENSEFVSPHNREALSTALEVRKRLRTEDMQQSTLRS